MPSLHVLHSLIVGCQISFLPTFHKAIQEAASQGKCVWRVRCDAFSSRWAPTQDEEDHVSLVLIAASSKQTIEEEFHAILTSDKVQKWNKSEVRKWKIQMDAGGE